MARLNLILLAALVVCALSVVTSQHRARKLYIELQKEQEVARKLDLDIRYEPLDPAVDRGRGGGLCRIRGRQAVLVDAGLAPAERAAVILGALARFDLDAVYLPPAVRQRIQAAGRPGGLLPRPLARTKSRPRGDD